MRNEFVRGVSYERPRAFFCPLAQQWRLACGKTLGNRENALIRAAALPQSSRSRSCSFSFSLPARRSD